MNCLDTKELKRLLASASPDELLSAQEHIRACERCRSELRKLAVHSRPTVDFAESLLGIADCPEYDALSSFVEGSLDARTANLIQAHVNSCDLCARDVEHITQLRSLATLREPVEVRPGASVQRGKSRLPLVGRLLGGVAIAGAVVAVVFALLPTAQVTTQQQVVAGRPPSVPTPEHQPVTVQPPPDTPVSPEAAVQPQPNPQPEPATAPAHKVVLVDGRYEVAKTNGKLVVMKQGTPVEVPQALLAAISAKVSTGRVALSQPAAVAMSRIRVRDSEGYVPPPTAPKLTKPVGKIVMSEQPRLEWAGIAPAHSYRVVISDREGNTVEDSTVAGHSHVMSSRLTRGQVYTWRVGVRFNENDDWTFSTAAKFTVLSDKDLAYVKQTARALPGSHLALGVAYESLGLEDEAAREYAVLHKSNPRARF